MAGEKRPIPLDITKLFPGNFENEGVEASSEWEAVFRKIIEASAKNNEPAEDLACEFTGKIGGLDAAAEFYPFDFMRQGLPSAVVVNFAIQGEPGIALALARWDGNIPKVIGSRCFPDDAITNQKVAEFIGKGLDDYMLQGWNKSQTSNPGSRPN